MARKSTRRSAGRSTTTTTTAAAGATTSVPTLNGSASSMKRSAFQRRKQYAERLKKTLVVSKPLRNSLAVTISSNVGDRNGTTNIRKNKNSTSFRSRPSRGSTKVLRESNFNDLPKFKSSVSREEMEELGCLPVGILSAGPALRERKGTLSFSPHTQTFERTPVRGTPLRGMGLAGKGKAESVAEVLATLQQLNEALANETSTDDDVLTDLKGIELGRRSILDDVAEFWLLKMKLLCNLNDRKQAMIAGIHALCATRNQREKGQIASRISTMLEAEVASGEPVSDDAENQNDETCGTGVGDQADSGYADDRAKDSPVPASQISAKLDGDFPSQGNLDKKDEDDHKRAEASRNSRSSLKSTMAASTGAAAVAAGGGGKEAQSPARFYTPPDVKTTPTVRCGEPASDDCLSLSERVLGAVQPLYSCNTDRSCHAGTDQKPSSLVIVGSPVHLRANNNNSNSSSSSGGGDVTVLERSIQRSGATVCPSSSVSTCQRRSTFTKGESPAGSDGCLDVVQGIVVYSTTSMTTTTMAAAGASPKQDRQGIIDGGPVVQARFQSDHVADCFRHDHETSSNKARGNPPVIAAAAVATASTGSGAETPGIMQGRYLRRNMLYDSRVQLLMYVLAIVHVVISYIFFL